MRLLPISVYLETSGISWCVLWILMPSLLRLLFFFGNTPTVSPIWKNCHNIPFSSSPQASFVWIEWHPGVFPGAQSPLSFRRRLPPGNPPTNSPSPFVNLNSKKGVERGFWVSILVAAAQRTRLMDWWKQIQVTQNPSTLVNPITANQTCKHSARNLKKGNTQKLSVNSFWFHCPSFISTVHICHLRHPECGSTFSSRCTFSPRERERDCFLILSSHRSFRTNFWNMLLSRHANSNVHQILLWRTRFNGFFLSGLILRHVSEREARISCWELLTPSAATLFQLLTSPL